MTLQTTGQITLDDIHVEAGGTTGTEASINDSDIRGIAASIPADNSPMPLSFWYGAPFSTGSWPTGAGSVAEPTNRIHIGYDQDGNGTGSAKFRWGVTHEPSNNRIKFTKVSIDDTTTTTTYAYFTYSGDVLDNVNNDLADWEARVDWTTSNTDNSGPTEFVNFITPTGYSSGTWYNVSTSTQDPLYEWGLTTDSESTSETEVTATFYIRCTKSGVSFPFPNGNANSGSITISISASASDAPSLICLHYDMLVELLNGQKVNVDKVNIGDLIKTNDGYSRVSKVIRNHIRSGYYIIENDLKITNDHPIKINGQWIKAEDYQGNKEYIEGKIPTVYIETETGEYLTFANGKSWTVSGNYGQEK